MDYFTILGLVTTNVRAPATAALDAQGGFVATFSPPLTTDEQIIYDRIMKLARSPLQGITLAEYATIEDDLAVVRTFRQQSQSEFIAKTQNARDREIFDTLNALINVQRAMLRD